MTPLRILFVTNMHPSSLHPLRGVIVIRIAQALRDLGHQIQFVEIGAHRSFVGYLRARRDVTRALREYQPDLIHVHFGYSGVAIPRCSVPIVTSFYGDDLNGTVARDGSTTLKSRVGIAIAQWMAWRSVRCIAVSAHLRDRLWLGASRRKTAVIRDAVDIDLFRPIPQDEARRHVGISSEGTLVIFPHDVSQPTKRLWLAEKALAVLKRSIPNADLWVVNGRPPDQMPWYYAAADAMLVTSEREGGPSSVKEALACGIPVVSVAVGDTELFAEVTDWMARADATPEALAEALRVVLTRKRSGERRSHLPRGLTLDNAAQAIGLLYQEVAKRGRAA